MEYDVTIEWITKQLGVEDILVSQSHRVTEKVSKYKKTSVEYKKPKTNARTSEHKSWFQVFFSKEGLDKFYISL